MKTRKLIKNMLAAGIDWAALTDFHARHKLILYSHNQQLGRELGRELAAAHREPVEDYAPRYLEQLMRILRISAKRSNHVNVLEHIRGYLKRELDRSDNPLKNAPHTAREVSSDDWSHAYSRELAAYPAPWTREYKYWPPVGRVDNAWGDRNLVCTHPSPGSLEPKAS